MVIFRSTASHAPILFDRVEIRHLFCMDAALKASGGVATTHISPPAAAPRTLRGLRIDEYSRAHSGVWYYQVDIELRYVTDIRVPVYGSLDSCDEDDVHCYSVRRRYNEFAQLYDKIKDEILQASTDPQHAIGDSGLPPFPQKELISSSVLGLLWRVSSPTYVLEDRRIKFEALLRWIECHPVLRDSQAYIDFLGQPPQVSEGYVSLKEYTSQNWLFSLEKLTKEKAKRRRRLSSDCSISQHEAPRSSKKRRQADRDVPAPSHKLTKRQKRLVAPSAATPCHKMRVRRRSYSTSDDTLRLLNGDGDPVAQVESSSNHKRMKIQ